MSITPGNDEHPSGTEAAVEFDFSGAEADISEGLFDTPVAPANREEEGELSLEVSAPASSSEPAAEPTAEAEPTPTTEQPSEPALEAPRTWRKEASEKWATLPPEVQREVLKREEDIFRGLEAYKSDAHVGKSVQHILAPYLPILQAANLDPLQQIDGLMRAHHALATGTPEQKAAVFQRLAQEYQVSLGGETPYVDPQVAALQKQLSEVQSRLMGRERQEAEVARTTLQREIDTFAADPAHPHFDEVANDIAGLLRSGAAQNLSDAYEKAIWLNPVTRGKEQARLAALETAAAEKRAQEARRAASANVRSKSKSAGATAPTGSIDDTLAATLAAINGRA